MKRILNIIRLLGLLTLVGTIAACGSALENSQQSILATPQVSPLSTLSPDQQGLLSLTCSPALRPDGQVAPAIAGARPTFDSSYASSTSATSLQLEHGERVSSLKLLMTLNPQAATMGSPIALYDHQLVMPTIDVDGWTCLHIVDIDTGLMEQIVTLKGRLQDLAMSDRYMVWTDDIYIPGGTPCPQAPKPAPDTLTPTSGPPCTDSLSQNRIETHLYDLQARRELKQWIAPRRSLNLTNDVLVWQEYSGIYGQRLITGQPFTVTIQDGSYPKVAGEWVAYTVRSKELPNMLAADLHLFNWRSGEDKLIGAVTNVVDGGGYAMDNELLTWINVLINPSEVTSPVYELHAYTLATGNDRIVNIGSKTYLTDLHLSDGLLVYTQEYSWQAIDLRQDLKFIVFSRPVGLESLGKIALSGNRIVWVIRNSSKITQLYATQIDRE